MANTAGTQKKHFKKWMETASKERGGRYTEATISSYASYLSKAPDFISKCLQIRIGSVFLLLSVGEAKSFSDEYSANILPMFKEPWPKEIRDFNSAFKAYMRFLAESESDEAFLAGDDVSPTEKEALIRCRIGQSDFRKKLIDIWGGCSVTGYDADVGLLIASHIKPWSISSEEERLNPNNGLLLTPNLDKVFDRGLVTFNEDGKIRISIHLRQPEKLGIHEGMKLIKLNDAIEPFMSYHRELFEQLEKS